MSARLLFRLQPNIRKHPLLYAEPTKIIIMANYLIIGGSSGIGLCLASLLAGEGHQVYATYNTQPAQYENPLIEHHQLNVLDENSSLDFLPETVAGIIYCPGSINLRPFERIKPVDFIADYHLQVVGAVKMIQAVLPRLKKATNASITLFSTVAVQNGLPFHSQVAASKGAIEGLTKALAAELAPSIRVNCIAPSLTDTPLAAGLLNTDQKREANALRHPLKKIGTVEDIANMAAFLISEKAGWITGQIMHVDGGMSTVK
jgi:NAD(P)-dependent dehydrogenase (short-subunit alcohol dehydrogenase family)